MEVESDSATAADVQQGVAERPESMQVADEQTEISQQVQEPEPDSVAAVLAQLSEPKVEAAAGQTHAEVLMAEQRVEAAQLAEGSADSTAVSQPEGLVIQLEQHEPAAEEDVSQHIQLKHLPDVNPDVKAESEVGQEAQPDSVVSSAAGNDNHYNEGACGPVEASTEGSA